MSTQFIIAVTSSLTTAAILYMLRQVVRARHAITRLADEHKFLMESMQAVLTHLNLENKPPERRKR
jgi:hypothetical protein